MTNSAKRGPTINPAIHVILIMDRAREYPPLGPDIPGFRASSASIVSVQISSCPSDVHHRRLLHIPVACIVPIPFKRDSQHPMKAIQTEYRLFSQGFPVTHVVKSLPGIPERMMRGDRPRKPIVVGVRDPYLSFIQPTGVANTTPGP